MNIKGESPVTRISNPYKKYPAHKPDPDVIGYGFLPTTKYKMKMISPWKITTASTPSQNEPLLFHALIFPIVDIRPPNVNGALRKSSISGHARDQLNSRLPPRS
jgi:hypothetical protein